MLKKDLVLGNKYKVIISTEYFPQGSVVIYHRDDGSDSPVFKRADGTISYLNVCRVAELNPVEDAEFALNKARAAADEALKTYNKAVADKEALNKFTEADIKNLMVVSLYSKEVPYDAGNLRLVAVTRDFVSFSQPNGYVTNICKRTALVNELNCTYYKTNKTLKDFADA